MRKTKTNCHHAAFGTALSCITIDREALAAIARLLADQAKTDTDRERLNGLAKELQG